ncbi:MULTISPECIES: hypothetical protein [unclassified Viridibacillus]|nr:MULTISPECIES: hypothetical protein [unclassified Viridibacillus]OMC82670.1 hypothetical protein BK128_19750 [Viridibacillus sp. FSL H7-0596]OMC84737.1 hypothetical protein BK130_03745 [Viridibacillus sp. FSL H8-0123]
MMPVTIIELTFIFVIISVIGLLALLLPKWWRRFTWGLACLILIITIGFYVSRPFIVQHQTEKAIENLNIYLKVKYVGESWEITDTDAYRIKPDAYLHVRFDNERFVTYKYQITKNQIKQTGSWISTSGLTPEEEGVSPIHAEK